MTIFTAVIVAIGVGILVWVWQSRTRLSNHRPIGGAQVDVSRNDRVQSETSIAVDPANPRILLAGSNDQLFVTRVYMSTNGGGTWRSVPGPPLASRRHCGDGDPAVAIAPGGEEYYAFLADTQCLNERPRIFVASRPNAHAAWRTSWVAARNGAHYIWDDKPAIAVDAGPASRFAGRVYLSWSRLETEELRTLEVSHSDDRGRTWSRPVSVGRGYLDPQTSSIAVGGGGQVYVVAADTTFGGTWLARSTDGGKTFRNIRRIANTPKERFPRCDHGGYPIPAQPKRCIEPNPIVDAYVKGPFAGAVVVTYSSHARRGNEHVVADAFDAHLRKLFRSSVTPDKRGADQFLPASTIDRTTGTLWTCFYDTTGDSTRRHAWYTCTVSRDEGRTWSPPVRAASAPSDETQEAASLSDYGDYEGLAVVDGTAYPIWTDTRRLAEQSEEIYVSAISASSLR